MAYVTPPTFVDGNVLSATQLNTLSANQEYLYEQAARVNVPQENISLTLGDGVGGEVLRKIRHKFLTLEYYINVVVGTFDDMTIRYDSTTVFSDATDRSAPYVYTGTIDLTSFGLTLGQVYTLKITGSGEPGSANNRMDALVLQEVAS